MPRETLSAPSHRTSGAKARAALGAPRVDDSPPPGRTHAGTETVCPFTLQNAGLECSFHGKPFKVDESQKAGTLRGRRPFVNAMDGSGESFNALWIT